MCLQAEGKIIWQWKKSVGGEMGSYNVRFCLFVSRELAFFNPSFHLPKKKTKTRGS